MRSNGPKLGSERTSRVARDASTDGSFQARSPSSQPVSPEAESRTEVTFCRAAAASTSFTPELAPGLLPAKIYDLNLNRIAAPAVDEEAIENPQEK
jgi:hypothetical protein